MSFLAQYIDAGLVIPEGTTKEFITKQEGERLSKMLAVAVTAGEVPRRLGADASSEELSLDKHRCRRIAHVASQCLRAWEGKANGSDVAIEAAQVDWKKWWADHQVFLANRITFIATWSYRTGEEEKWAKSAVVRLTNETAWLANAMRD